VVALRPLADGSTEVELADGSRHRAPRVILSTDAWTNDLLMSFDRRLPLTIIEAQVTYFASPDPALFAPDRFPIWIWMDDPSFYGFPTYGEPGPKSAEDVGGEEVMPATRTFQRNEIGFARLTDFLARYLPDQLGPEIVTKTCLYTLTPDRDFVIDRLPDQPGVLVALGAAHAYKFASVIGRILAELAVDGATPSAGEIERFRIDRPILLETNPQTSFLV
jgi:sarcosine oxidase